MILTIIIIIKSSSKMVFHITNYMRETNVWMIRKMRWMLWGFCLFIPLYRTFYWDYIGRRVVFKDWLRG